VAATSAGVASALLSPVSVAAVVATTVTATAIATGLGESEKVTSQPIMAETVVVQQDNFWTLLGQIVEMGGWILILVIVVPMILGWILPGPLTFKRKKNGNI
tara:strand:+ start:184 stop:489 length:306 start_codon:yes stop_codon:yes gene_type:complete